MIPRKYLPEDKLRQKICQGSPELRNLASQLEQAYINKARSAQLAELRLKQQAEESDLETERQEKERERLINLQIEQNEIRDETIKKLRYGKELDEQLQVIQIQRNRVFDQFLEEKKLIDQIIDRIQRENQEKILRRIQDKQEKQAAIDTFIAGQKKWVELEEERKQKENSNIKTFLAEKEMREREVERAQTARRALKNQHVLRLSEQIHVQEEEKREKEQILMELLEIQREREDRRREESELENELRRKVNLRESNFLAAQYRKDREDRAAEEEETWKQKMMEKFAEDDKLEQLSVQRQRMRREEHRRAVQALLEDRTHRRELAKAEETGLWAEVAAEQAEQNSILAEERRRILREHFLKLQGYIPKGLLSQADLNELGEQLNINGS